MQTYEQMQSYSKRVLRKHMADEYDLTFAELQAILRQFPRDKPDAFLNAVGAAYDYGIARGYAMARRRYHSKRFKCRCLLRCALQGQIPRARPMPL